MGAGTGRPIYDCACARARVIVNGTTAQAFVSFEVDIAPTDWQWAHVVQSRKESVSDHLRETFPSWSDMPLWRVELIGSAAKQTIIRPLDDVNVLAVFSDANGIYEERYRSDSQAFLARARSAYSARAAQAVGNRGQAVRVFFPTGGHVDVAPVFFVGGDDYLLPARDRSWAHSSPLKANAWFDRRDQDLSGHLRPVVRLLKKWNAQEGSFKSFHLETMAASLFSTLGSNHRVAVARFFEWAPHWLKVTDPGGHSGDLGTYLGRAARQEALRSLASAATRASQALAAEAAGSHDEAKRLWQVLLGDDFPA